MDQQEWVNQIAEIERLLRKKDRSSCSEARQLFNALNISIGSYVARGSNDISGLEKNRDRLKSKIGMLLMSVDEPINDLSKRGYKLQNDRAMVVLRINKLKKSKRNDEKDGLVELGNSLFLFASEIASIKKEIKELKDKGYPPELDQLKKELCRNEVAIQREALKNIPDRMSVHEIRKRALQRLSFELNRLENELDETEKDTHHNWMILENTGNYYTSIGSNQPDSWKINSDQIDFSRLRQVIYSFNGSSLFQVANLKSSLPAMR